MRALLNEEYLTTGGSVNTPISQQVGGVERVTEWRVERNLIVPRYLPLTTNNCVKVNIEFTSGFLRNYSRRTVDTIVEWEG